MGQETGLQSQDEEVGVGKWGNEADTASESPSLQLKPNKGGV